MWWRGHSGVRAGEVVSGAARCGGGAGLRQGLGAGPRREQSRGRRRRFVPPAPRSPARRGPGCTPGRALGAGARRHRPPTPGTPQVPVTRPDGDSPLRRRAREEPRRKRRRSFNLITLRSRGANPVYLISLGYPVNL